MKGTGSREEWPEGRRWPERVRERWESAIKDERRRELAGEGHRFFDLVRWGDAAAKLGSRGFVAGKNEIFPIPIRELNSTKLKQNPNY